LTWGNFEAVKRLLQKIAQTRRRWRSFWRRNHEVPPSLSARGPLEIGVYIKTVRCHGVMTIVRDGGVLLDHGDFFHEYGGQSLQFQSTCSGRASLRPPSRSNAKEVARIVAGTKGRHAFEDSLAICAFTCRSCEPRFLTDALNLVTGWDWENEDVPRLDKWFLTC